MKLTDKQAAFCSEFLIDINGTQAAIRAGYSKKSAEQQAVRLLRNARVCSRVAELMAERNKDNEIDAAWVLKHNSEMVKADIIDIVDKDGGYKPIEEWPQIWRQMLSGMDVQQLYAGAGDDKVRIGEIVKPRFIDRLRALELLGKHNDIAAYAERHNHTHTMTMEDFVIQKAKERADGRSSNIH